MARMARMAESAQSPTADPDAGAPKTSPKTSSKTNAPTHRRPPVPITRPTPPPEQLSLPFQRPGRGGARKGAGRKRSPSSGIEHKKRAPIVPKHPQQITIRCAREVAFLRRPVVRKAVHALLQKQHERWPGFRVTAFSVQSNHLHLIVEADSVAIFASAIRGLCIRIARQLNRVLRRRGRFFAEWHHRECLECPRHARNSLAYVLLNHRRHAHKRGDVVMPYPVDPYSSARWFDGFVEPIRLAEEARPTLPARTWLGTVGWRLYGLISLFETPGKPSAGTTTPAQKQLLPTPQRRRRDPAQLTLDLERSEGTG